LIIFKRYILMTIPYDILLRICIFIDSRNDLYNFLITFDLENQYDYICEFIYRHYITELLPNDEVSIFLDIDEFSEGAYPDELFPMIATDEYTSWCSKMVKEYITFVF
jgi:hypothetical protein